MRVDIPLSIPSLPSPDPGRETRKTRRRSTRTPPLCLSSLCTTPTSVSSPQPTHSACRCDQAPPARSQSRSTRHRRGPSPGPPCAGHLWTPTALASPAYKRTPCLPEKNHTTASNLLDILLFPLALHSDLAGAGRAPGPPRVPSSPVPPPTCCLLEMDEKSSLCLLDNLAAAATLPGELP
jgi:hypothetical protein